MHLDKPKTERTPAYQSEAAKSHLKQNKATRCRAASLGTILQDPPASSCKSKGRPSPGCEKVTSSLIDRALDSRSLALVALGKFLQRQNYRFITTTPATHARVLARQTPSEAENLTDIFGWSRFFRRDRFPDVAEMLFYAGELEANSDLVRSKVRFSTLGDQLYVHSAYPTDSPDAVFFGPDTYRFVRIIKHFLPKGNHRPTRIIDLGCGTGAGGIYAASLVSGVKPQLMMVDVNEKALRYTRVNCAINGAQACTAVQSDLFDALDANADLIISNPPYLVDPMARAYRHGGPSGFDLSHRIAAESLSHLNRGGRMILYTGTPVVDGTDLFLTSLSKSFSTEAQSFLYEEVDPDVFGEELETPNYSHVDRIAAVSVIADLK